MAEHTVPKRRGRACNFTLDFDAAQLLEELAPSPKRRGTFVSSLIRAERARLLEYQRLKKAVEQVFEESAP